MHEGKGLSAGEPKMEVDVVHRTKGLDLETEKLLIKKSGPKGLHIVSIVSGGGGGGSAGDESSSDEPAQQENGGCTKATLKTHSSNHHALHPKKYRLKEPSLAPLLLERPLSRGGRSPIPTGSGGSSKDEDEEMLNIDDSNEDDDKSSGPSVKDSGISHSFTSGENSDSEMGCDGDGDGDGDEMLELGKQEDLNRKVFECDVCNMKFSNGANMRRHRMRHTGVKPYECRVCQKRFFRKDHLAEHMATHSKLLPFRCPICNKGFQRQIAMRAHFQNEHVGGSHDMVKACPLCSYKAGSMKSLRVHFYSRHGIDLDNPMPHSPSLQGTANGGAGSPGPSGSGNGEYSELAQALGFDDHRDKSSDSSLIPSHFLVPQIEISAISPYPSNFFQPDSSYPFAQDDRQSSNGDTPPPNVSPLSDRSSHTPSSSDLVVVKREVMDDHHVCPEQPSRNLKNANPRSNHQISESSTEEVQDAPEDLSQSANSLGFRLTPSSRSSSAMDDSKTLSPLKSLLRDDFRRDTHNVGTNFRSSTNGSSLGTNTSTQGSSSGNAMGSGNMVDSVLTTGSLSGGTTINVGSSGSTTTASSHNGQSGTSAHSRTNIGYQAPAHDGDTITSSNSNGSESSASPQSSTFNRRSGATSAIHQCVYCGIIFPDKTLYFLHKGCHSSPPQMWRCNICGEACTNVYDFNSHLLSKSHQ